MTTVRCSSLDRLISCPGSRTLEAIVEPIHRNDGAQGDRLHAHIAGRLVPELGATASIPLHHVELHENEMWLADYCVREVVDRVPSDWSIEVEVPVAYQFNGFNLSGHIDCLAVSPEGHEAMFFDWKTGYAPTDPAESNWQVAGYMALLLRAYPELVKIQAYIVQPRNNEEEGFERVSSSIRSGDIITMQAMCWQIEKRIIEAINQPMQLDSGPKQCRFCPAVLQCPAIRQEIMKLTLTAEELAQIKTHATDEKIAELVCAAKTLEEPIELAKEIAKERIAQKGYIKSITGTTISVKETKGSYEVNDKDAFYATLTKMVPADRLAHCTKPQMSEIKKEIAAAQNVPISGKAAINGTTLFDAKLRNFCTQGTRKTLVFS